jgi:hypothetical protein
MISFMKVSSKEIKDMDMGEKYITMEIIMREDLEMTREKVKESMYAVMEGNA